MTNTPAYFLLRLRRVTSDMFSRVHLLFPAGLVFSFRVFSPSASVRFLGLSGNLESVADWPTLAPSRDCLPVFRVWSTSNFSQVFYGLGCFSGFALAVYAALARPKVSRCQGPWHRPTHVPMTCRCRALVVCTRLFLAVSMAIRIPNPPKADPVSCLASAQSWLLHETR